MGRLLIEQDLGGRLPIQQDVVGQLLIQQGLVGRLPIQQDLVEAVIRRPHCAIIFCAQVKSLYVMYYPKRRSMID